MKIQFDSNFNVVNHGSRGQKNIYDFNDLGIGYHLKLLNEIFGSTITFNGAIE